MKQRDPQFLVRMPFYLACVVARAHEFSPYDRKKYRLLVVYYAGYIKGAPNDQIFPNTPEVFQVVFPEL